VAAPRFRIDQKSLGSDRNQKLLPSAIFVWSNSTLPACPERKGQNLHEQNFDMAKPEIASFARPRGRLQQKSVYICNKKNVFSEVSISSKTNVEYLQYLCYRYSKLLY
jgi:hypothetical protein